LTRLESCTTRRRAHQVDRLQRLRRVALGAGDLQHDVVLLAVHVEAGHLPAAEQRLHGAADDVDDAEIGGALPVDRDLDLRLVEDEVGSRDWSGSELATSAINWSIGLDLGIGLRGAQHELDRLAGAWPWPSEAGLVANRRMPGICDSPG
jgi:hypothetical protein